MNILIVEDEPRAANRLQRILTECSDDIEIIGVLSSIKECKLWFRSHPQPDLVFLDIQLEDGNSFDMLSDDIICAPIIFCTAFSQHALDAFSTPGIDYLLKPVNQRDVIQALNKYHQLYQMMHPDLLKLKSTGSQKHYMQQILVTLAGRHTPIKFKDVGTIQSYLKGVKLTTLDKKEWIVDTPLYKLEARIDPSMFIRIHRQCLIALSQIDNIQRNKEGYSVHMKHNLGILKISRARAKSVKEILSK